MGLLYDLLRGKFAPPRDRLPTDLDQPSDLSDLQPGASMHKKVSKNAPGVVIMSTLIEEVMGCQQDFSLLRSQTIRGHLRRLEPPLKSETIHGHHIASVATSQRTTCINVANLC